MFGRIRRWRRRREIEEEVEWEYHRGIESYNPDEADSFEHEPNLGSEKSEEMGAMPDFVQSEGIRTEHIRRAIVDLEKGDVYQAILDISIATETMLKTVLVISEPNVRLSELINEFSKKARYKDLGMDKSQFQSMISNSHKVRMISNVFKHGVIRDNIQYPPGSETAMKFYPLSKLEASKMIEFLSISIEKAYSWHNGATGAKEMHYKH